MMRTDAETVDGAEDILKSVTDLGLRRLLVVAIPEPFEAGQAVEQARAVNPAITIIARAHFDSAVIHLRQLGADIVIMGEREIARAMLDDAAHGAPRGSTPGGGVLAARMAERALPHRPRPSGPAAPDGRRTERHQA
ncbi:NAD-binding protein [Nguyenibacter sp. L1]|uniref:NAD-binding protein n=1 Tax=Nguyenibacter sp. L1 TaxID=3049350 RepID=UPI002B4A7A92|nr:NAD-binding protein [Nguyenibacter sp. L1]WRH88801.1 NAD-binding protein [Nguyenibacter sp. L1]